MTLMERNSTYGMKKESGVICVPTVFSALFFTRILSICFLITSPRPLTSWNSCADEISPMETLEVHVVNSIAPFTLIQALKPHMLPPDPFLALDEGKLVHGVSFFFCVMSGGFNSGFVEEIDLDSATQLSSDCSFVINVSSVEGSSCLPPSTNKRCLEVNSMV